jgi:hypothetical protein
MSQFTNDVIPTAFAYVKLTNIRRMVTASRNGNVIGHFTWIRTDFITEYEMPPTREGIHIGIMMWDWMLANVPTDEQPPEPDSKDLTPAGKRLYAAFMDRAGRHPVTGVKVAA